MNHRPEGQVSAAEARDAVPTPVPGCMRGGRSAILRRLFSAKRPAACAMGTPYTIDRIEDDTWAVLEDADGMLLELPVGWLPADAREGDRLMVAVDTEADTATLSIRRDEEATAQRRKDLQRRRNRLREDSGGDITL